ncbi:hypothetical protein SPFL3102_03271 [Sporomusaceae bacterium FL31]|nr:hypothetical protein SPFL3101_00800 [Sporomusaceae bacterium FL31]GCE35435.1 hypothetical protein SPFL3102_03271 [Sporomusaceae bacterium]
MMEYSFLLVNLVVILMLFVGVSFTLIGMPGNLLIFITAVAYAYFGDFAHINVTMLLILLGALICGEIVESVAGALGAKKEQASKRAIAAAFFGSIIGGIIGTGILPVIGSIAGAICGGFSGSYLAEYTKSKDSMQASRVAHSVIKGQIIGLIVKFAIAITMVIYVLSKMPWQEYV